jgi:magnesium chelatase family protein
LGQIQKYQARISGPILDRIDLHVEVPTLPREILLNEEAAESSASIRERILAARARQADRFPDKVFKINRFLRPREIKRFCRLDTGAEKLLSLAIREFGFSARAYFKILKIARTIADLAGEDRIEETHVAEAIQYRSLDRNWIESRLG